MSHHSSCLRGCDHPDDCQHKMLLEGCHLDKWLISRPGPAGRSCGGFLLLLLSTVLGGGKGRREGGGYWIVVCGGGLTLGSELMIGNDGAEDTWDNDGVANSPDD